MSGPGRLAAVALVASSLLTPTLVAHALTEPRGTATTREMTP